MTGKRSEIQFIFSSHSGLHGVKSAETQRRVHSHAARAAHAKARRQRLLNYQDIEDGRNSEDKTQLSTKTTAQVGLNTILSPISLLGSGRRDPFASFARHLNPMEDFLLDYCE